MTVPIGVNPALLGMSSAVEAAGAATMGGGAAGAAPAITMVLPPGADGASAAAAAGLNARGAETLAVLADLTAVRGLFAEGIAVSGVSYAAVDAISQAALAL